MKKSPVLLFPALLFSVLLYAQETSSMDLSLRSEDLRIEQGVDGGFHLYIRKKPGIGSVLITESTQDPAMKLDNYAYRAPDWNPINGDEVRLIDDVPIPKSSKIWSLIDSTPENHRELGPAFHIYIPYILNYGYEYTRHGEISVGEGTFLNIRAFSLPSGDYRGHFRDNPFVLSVSQEPLEGPPEGNYMKETEKSFSEIASQGKGELVHSTGAADLVDKIKTILEKEAVLSADLDLVICLDTTASMRNDINAVREAIIPMLKEILPRFKSFRIGMVLYKDYFDDYLNKVIPFTSDFALFQRTLNGINVGGGRDIPEAVYEALYEAAVKFPWANQTKLVILIGDAPPHLRQKGKISKEMVDKEVAERSLRVHAIILPQ
jgi:hypothetical protein